MILYSIHAKICWKYIEQVVGEIRWTHIGEICWKHIENICWKDTEHNIENTLNNLLKIHWNLLQTQNVDSKYGFRLNNIHCESWVLLQTIAEFISSRKQGKISVSWNTRSYVFRKLKVKHKLLKLLKVQEFADESINDHPSLFATISENN